MKSFDYHSLSPSLLLYELCDPYVSGNNFIIIIRTTPRSDYLRDISFTSEATSLLFIDYNKAMPSVPDIEVPMIKN